MESADLIRIPDSGIQVECKQNTGRNGEADPGDRRSEWFCAGRDTGAISLQFREQLGLSSYLLGFLRRLLETRLPSDCDAVSGRTESVWVRSR